MKLIFDIETNGLLPELDTVWMICTYDIETKESKSFCDHAVESGSIKEGLAYLEKAEMLSGHFILGFDLFALKKVYGWFPRKEVALVDTLLLSQVLNYKRFSNGKHNLDTWGKFFGQEKPPHEDWLNYSPEMLHRCKEDVGINTKVYQHLMYELKSAHVDKLPLIKLSLRNEHDTLLFCSMAKETGWRFDVVSGNGLLVDMEARMKIVEDIVNPLLDLRVKKLDTEPKKVKFLKSGLYPAHIAKYFSVTQESALEDRPIMGDYSRIEFIKPDIGNIDSVKEHLYTIGWVPDDWNWKKEGREFIKVSAKLTSSSLEPLGEFGKHIDDYYTIRSRHSILKGWLELVDKDGFLHGDCFTIGTPTSRARHSIIANVPSGGSMYGNEIRKLFIAREGHSIIGADSSGNQFRALCHYLKNDDYTNEVLNGDVHQKNADVLSSILEEEVARRTAKPFIYAYLFGGGGEKLSLILKGKRDKKLGNKVKLEFAKRIPGLHELITKIGIIYRSTEQQGHPWIPGLDGTKVYCESPHKALNYLLQKFEAVTCKAATAQIKNKLEEENIPYFPLIFYHDEVEFEVPNEYAERASVIAKEAFRDAPKMFNAVIMDGEAKIGFDWYDVH
jgi:hypothetical protein